MPSALSESIAPPPLESLPRKRWTRAEIEELTSLGWFGGEHYELIDGELLNKTGKHEAHVLAVLLIQEWLISIFGFWRVRKEDPIDVATQDNEHNEPEPDLVVLKEPIQNLQMRRPGPEDVLLAIEVADSTLRMDRSKKADLYARAGIPDYWILDMQNRRMIVHREPAAGRYASVIAYRADESVAPLAAPDSEFHVARAFGE
jgi:Uma2 family endonuclease